LSWKFRVVIVSVKVGLGRSSWGDPSTIRVLKFKPKLRVGEDGCQNEEIKDQSCSLKAHACHCEKIKR
jgi:hypothetical protein